MKLSEAAAAKLLDLINVQKKYVPGDQLPNEAALADELGVSRTTARTAVQYLVGQGILEIQRGRGTFVAMPQEEKPFRFDQLNTSHLQLRDIYELRLALEPQMAYYAAIRATDEELERIMRMGNRVLASCEEHDQDEEGNNLFHDAVVQATHNEFNIELMKLLNDALVQALLETPNADIMYAGTTADHQLIMDFLRIRDPDGAKLAMELHLKHAMKCYGLI